MPPSLEQRRKDEVEAIKNCHAEPIHLLGTVQPFGFLLAVTAEAPMTVTHASENIAALAGIGLDDVLGVPVQTLVPETVVHTIRNASGHSTIRHQREHVGVVGLGADNNPFDVSLHRSGESLIIEFQPTSDAYALAQTLGEAQRVLTSAASISSQDELLDSLVHQLRQLTGYDRVKAYQFLPDGAGEVVAEARSAMVESFLGLRFPAFDIPPRARQLYAATPIRVISDVGAAQPEIHSAVPGADPVDLSLALIRGTLPGHMAFLENMGVQSTMSLPIVVDGEMWGLFSLHGYEPRVPPSVVTMTCELIGRSTSIMMQGLLQRKHTKLVDRCALIAPELLVVDDDSLALPTQWNRSGERLFELITSDGVALIGENERVLAHGDCPSPDAIRAVAERLIVDANVEPESGEERVVLSEVSLSSRELEVDVGPAAGALVLPAPAPSVRSLIYFRNESRTALRWAGDAAGSFEETSSGLRLTPRGSFAEYLDTADGRCDPWSDDDIAVATALQDAFSKVRARSEVHQYQRDRLGLVVRELNHRVRNILALVRSLVRQTRGSADSLSDYVESLEKRITALAGAHDLLTENDWQDIEIERLIAQTLVAYGTDQDSPRIMIEGPPLLIPANLASILSLVIHELASNAARYGALSNTSGTVHIRWGFDESDESFALHWEEDGGPQIIDEPGEGFGTSIIRNALPFEFEATATLSFDKSGAQARFGFPPDLIEAPAIDGTPLPLRVLIVEDDYLVSRATAAVVEEAGHIVDAIESSVPSALHRVEAQHFDFVLLDADVRGVLSGEVAEALTASETPFVFLTGYGSDPLLQQFAAAGVIEKPLTVDALKPYLKELGMRRDRST